MVAGEIVGVLVILIVIGVPIGYAMAVAGVFGLWIIGGVPMVAGVLSTAPISTVAVYELVSIPMFILMAEFVIVSGIAAEIFDAMVVLIGGRVRGGLAIATAIAGAGFGAISGSSTAAAATLASTSLPAMRKHGYNAELANGVVAISGTLAMLVPPSIALIIYSFLADVSTEKTLIAGVVPGVVITFVISATVYILVWHNPSLAPPGTRTTAGEKLRALRGTAGMLVLILLITGTLYTGIATPSESSALGAFCALCIAIAKRRMRLATFAGAVVRAATTTAMIFTILIGAHIFSYALTLSQAPQQILSTVGALRVNPYVIIALLLLLKLLLGFFLDQIAILLLMVPIVVPIVVKLGFDPIWFGIMMVVTAEVGMVTPPVGMNLFVISRYTGTRPEVIFKGVLPHIVAHVFAIILFVAFPAIVLWLPSTMKN
jgi:tripartite ATP-independent transporter DctM subunit